MQVRAAHADAATICQGKAIIERALHVGNVDDLMLVRSLHVTCEQQRNLTQLYHEALEPMRIVMWGRDDH